MRVELIDGELLDLAANGPRHWSMVARLTHLLHAAPCQHALVAVRLPLRLNHLNEPRPDVAVVHPRADFYAHAHPTGRDVFLVIEVAESSLAFDLRIKARLYAAHGVPEYWVIDLDGRRLHRHRTAQGEAYTEVTVIDRPGMLTVPGLDGVTIDLSRAW